MILITGATGTIGRELTPLLFEAGQSIRVFVRDEKKLFIWTHKLNAS